MDRGRGGGGDDEGKDGDRNGGGGGGGGGGDGRAATGGEKDLTGTEDNEDDEDDEKDLAYRPDIDENYTQPADNYSDPRGYMPFALPQERRKVAELRRRR